MADQSDGASSDQVDLLIGADFLHQIYNGPNQVFGSLVATPTIFGYFLWGTYARNQYTAAPKNSNAIIQSLVCASDITLREDIQKSRETLENLDFLWDSEFLGIEASTADEDESSKREVLEWFENTVQRSSKGRYIVSLPFRNNLSALGDNQRLAYSSLMSFLRNARRRPEFLKAVDQEVSKFIAAGHAE